MSELLREAFEAEIKKTERFQRKSEMEKHLLFIRNSDGVYTYGNGVIEYSWQGFCLGRQSAPEGTMTDLTQQN